jgi:hypothetical protein
MRCLWGMRGCAEVVTADKGIIPRCRPQYREPDAGGGPCIANGIWEAFAFAAETEGTMKRFEPEGAFASRPMRCGGSKPRFTNTFCDRDRL